ncbi:hypothetical protein EJB05_40754, partial [Eragrostis curvula]
MSFDIIKPMLCSLLFSQLHADHQGRLPTFTMRRITKEGCQSMSLKPMLCSLLFSQLHADHQGRLPTFTMSFIGDPEEHRRAVRERRKAAVMSALKRKMGDMGDQVVSAAVGDVVGRTMSAAVGSYDARASVDEQLRRLNFLVIQVHATVDQADGVHIRSWWLRRWLWRLRDTALEGDEVLRLFRQRRAAEEAAAAAGPTGNTLWNAVRRAFESAKSLLFPTGDDDMDRLSRTVERLEMACTGINNFTQLLNLELRPSEEELRAEARRFTTKQSKILSAAKELVPNKIIKDKVGNRRKKDNIWQASMTILDGAGYDHEIFYISREEYIASMIRIGLLMMRENTWRAVVKRIAGENARLMATRLKTGAYRQHAPMTDACGAVRQEAAGKPAWLPEWRHKEELQVVADRAARARCATDLAFCR